METRRTFHLGRNVRLFYALAVAREFTPMLAVWVVYLTDFRHLTLTQVGVMEGLFWAVKLGLELPSGAFADRFGRRATFITGIAMEATDAAENGVGSYNGNRSWVVPDFFLVKLTPAGQLDPGFGTGGIAEQPNLADIPAQPFVRQTSPYYRDDLPPDAVLHNGISRLIVPE